MLEEPTEAKPDVPLPVVLGNIPWFDSLGKPQSGSQ